MESVFELSDFIEVGQSGIIDCYINQCAYFFDSDLFQERLYGIFRLRIQLNKFERVTLGSVGKT